jgi:hypothetical protein
MAEVLGPISTTGTMTIPYSQDAFQNSNSTGLTNARRQSSRHSMYNMPSNMSYRGPSSVPISPYAFQNAPNTRQDASTHLAPNSYTFRGQYDSSASSVSSASSSSNRSAQAHYGASKDDSVLTSRKRQSYVDNRLSQNFPASLSTPDLTQSLVQDAKASPDRYRRPAKIAENQRPRPSSSSFAPPSRSMSDNLEIRRASVGARTGSYEDGSTSNAARYKRRSVMGRIESSSAINLPGSVPSPAAPSHTRSNSYGDKSSNSAPIKPKTVSLLCLPYSVFPFAIILSAHYKNNNC